jgi:hypothetical protein
MIQVVTVLAEGSSFSFIYKHINIPGLSQVYAAPFFPIYTFILSFYFFHLSLRFIQKQKGVPALFAWAILNVSKILFVYAFWFMKKDPTSKCSICIPRK